MFVAAALLLQRGGGGDLRAVPVHQVVVQFLAPRRGVHQRGLIFAPDDVPPEDVAALGIPDMRMQTRTDRDVVLDHAPEAFAVLDPAAQTEIVGDDVKG